MKLKINDVHKFYGSKESRIEVLKGINCQVEDGEICVLLGPSGSGKSTLLNIVGGLESADSGCIDIGDFCTENMSDKELGKYRRNNLGFVFQFYNLVSDLTIKENIEVCAYLTKNPLDIDDLLHTLGLYEHKDKFPNQLSGGQQQRCAIGRALVKNPPILLFDEPTGALDYKTSKEILDLIEKINKKYHNTMIIVTHNQVISQMADRVLKLRDGVIVSEVVNKEKTPASELEW
ncbi:MAG: ABC transporter ATP-binding protein [Lachnospiraceae bacterium]|nr:ABC transporter ATP-binding protein [Lachnospiraceae bacterium]